MKPLWTDRDRSPSEPNFTDYTYVYFQGHKIGEIEDIKNMVAQVRIANGFKR